MADIVLEGVVRVGAAVVGEVVGKVVGELVVGGGIMVYDAIKDKAHDFKREKQSRRDRIEHPEDYRVQLPPSPSNYSNYHPVSPVSPRTRKEGTSPTPRRTNVLSGPKEREEDKIMFPYLFAKGNDETPGFEQATSPKSGGRPRPQPGSPRNPVVRNSASPVPPTPKTQETVPTLDLTQPQEDLLIDLTSSYNPTPQPAPVISLPSTSNSPLDTINFDPFATKNSTYAPPKNASPQYLSPNPYQRSPQPSPYQQPFAQAPLSPTPSPHSRSPSPSNPHQRSPQPSHSYQHPFPAQAPLSPTPSPYSRSPSPSNPQQRSLQQHSFPTQAPLSPTPSPHLRTPSPSNFAYQQLNPSPYQQPMQYLPPPTPQTPVFKPPEVQFPATFNFGSQ